MKIAKEIWLVVITIAFLLAYLLDKIAGPVNIVIGSPIAFLSSSVLLYKYPLTTTAIIIRSMALFIATMLIASLIERKYFTKAIVLFFIGLLAEFYAIQQITTAFYITTIQWTLSIAYASLSLSLGIIWMIIMGIWSLFNKQEIKNQSVSKTEQKSVLEPPIED